MSFLSSWRVANLFLSQSAVWKRWTGAESQQKQKTNSLLRCEPAETLDCSFNIGGSNKPHGVKRQHNLIIFKSGAVQNKTKHKYVWSVQLVLLLLLQPSYAWIWAHTNIQWLWFSSCTHQVPELFVLLWISHDGSPVAHHQDEENRKQMQCSRIEACPDGTVLTQSTSEITKHEFEASVYSTPVVCVLASINVLTVPAGL